MLLFFLSTIIVPLQFDDGKLRQSVLLYAINHLDVAGVYDGAYLKGW